MSVGDAWWYKETVAISHKQALLCLSVMTASVAWAGKNKDAETVPLVEQVVDGSLGPNQAANRISYLGTERFATDLLVDRLRKSADPKARSAMLEVLAQVAAPSDDGAVVVARSLTDETLGNRMAAAKALGRMHAAAAAPKLEAMLADKASGARREATRALAALGRPQSGAALAAAAKVETDLDTRAAMLWATGKAGDAKQAPKLESFLENDSESTRVAAAQGLCLLGAPKGVAFAKKLLTSRDKYERVQGVTLFEGTSLKLAAPVLNPVFEGVPGDDDHAVRAAAARVLAQLGDPSKTVWLLKQSTAYDGKSAQVAYENEIEKLHLKPEAKAALLGEKAKP